VMMRRLAAAVAAFLAFAGGATAKPQQVYTVTDYILVSCNACTADPVQVFHWGYHTVWIEDHTGWRWPVRESQQVWQQGTDVDVRYGACRANAGCVRAYEGWWTGVGWGAQTTLVLACKGCDKIVKATIQLNNAGYKTAHERRQDTCHEEAHGLGLWYHHTNLASCLYKAQSNSASIYPTAWDKRNLNRVY
jgi:hypothetical protein